MKNFYFWLIGICLLSGQLAAMESSRSIDLVDKLKQLATGCRPENYEKKLEESIVIDPRVITDSIVMLLDGQHVPIEVEGYIQTVSHDKEQYKTLIMQIMHEFDHHADGNLSANNTVKSRIFKCLDNKIDQKTQEFEKLYKEEWFYKRIVMVEGIAIGVCIVLNLILLIPLLTAHIY
jgi:hypothetical protein